MNLPLLMQAIVAVFVASVVIMYACNEFEDAADHLGRNMKPGIKGATINAIGSSLPEMLTTFFLLFMFNDMAGFSAGVATTAGSAIFNSVVIPLLCILAVRYYGVKQKDGTLKKMKSIEIDKSSLKRDIFFLLTAEMVLIYFLGNTHLTWVAGLSLVGFYAVYLAYLLYSNRSGSVSLDNEEEEEEEEDEGADSPSKLKALLTFQFNELFFGGSELTTKTAWINLSCSVLVIAVACHFLAESVMWSSEALNIPAYFTAIIFAAAATSVPDAILSVKDSIKGNPDDSLSNAIGSNTFDITVALGLPLLAYSLIYGDVTLITGDTTNEDMQVLRYVLVGITSIVAASFLFPKLITQKHAILMGVLYSGWMCYVIYSAGEETQDIDAVTSVVTEEACFTSSELKTTLCKKNLLSV
jgi:Ca2+/Na+ antiporter